MILQKAGGHPKQNVTSFCFKFRRSKVNAKRFQRFHRFHRHVQLPKTLKRASVNYPTGGKLQAQRIIFLTIHSF